MSVASMRASYMKDNVLALATLGEDALRIRQACAGAIASIENASRTDWLPVSVDIELTEAIAREVGDEATMQHARTALLSSMEGPLLRPLRDVTIRVFGAHPHAVIKIAPRAWPMIFRDCGALDYTTNGPREGRLTLKNAAHEIIASNIWCRGAAATFAALATVGGAKHPTAQVEIEDTSVVWTLRWSG